MYYLEWSSGSARVDDVNSWSHDLYGDIVISWGLSGEGED